MSLFLLFCDLPEVQRRIFFYAVFMVLYSKKQDMICAHKVITELSATVGATNVCDINDKEGASLSHDNWMFHSCPCLVSRCFFSFSLGENVGL